jgi:predicted dehydrogenase
MTKRVTRRRFLQVAAGAAAAGLVSHSAQSHALGANNDIRIAIVGLNGHGTGGHLKRYLQIPGVRVVALCDPDQAVLERSSKLVEKNKIRRFTDIRKLLELKDIDAISGATPNHWHALSTVWACQAGKHVCVEKPVSHTIWEGRKMVEAAAKYRRLVQADLDLRSSPSMVQAIDYIRSGQLGKILFVHSWVYKRRTSLGRVNGAGSVPASVDYDLWCGPSPKIPLPRKKLHYDWHWQWDTGNGEIGNNGPHHLDVCRWVLGEKGLPRSVVSFGGRYGYTDDGQTPNTQVAFFEYPTAPILFEVRGLPRNSGDKRMDPFRAMSRKGRSLFHDHDSASPNNGTWVVCEGGTVDLPARIAYDLQGKEIKRFTAQGPSCTENFITALRSGKESDLHTTILEGHLSTSICHMGNISYRVGQLCTEEQVHDVIKKNAQILDAYERMQSHLSANGVQLEQHGLTLGPVLSMNSNTERFYGPFKDAANALLKRNYRKPFVIPENV